MNVLVIGSSPQALFMVRQLAKAGYIVSILVSELGPAWHSKYVRDRFFVENSDGLFSCLESIRKVHGYIKLYITSGPELDSLVNYMPEVYNWFDVFPKPLTDVKLFSNKLNTYKLAYQCNIPVLESESLLNYLGVCSKLKGCFPVIIKWNREISSPKTSQFKTIVLWGDEYISESIAEIDSCDYENIIVQPYVISDHDCNVSYLGMYSEGANVVGMLATQLRQYPQGITSSVVEYSGIDNEQLKVWAHSLLQKTNYTGFAEVEFKIDNETGEVFLLEVNPRPCGWSSAIAGKHPDIYKLLLSETQELAKCKSGVSWVNIVREIRYGISYSIKEKSISPLIDGIHSVMSASCYDVFSLADIKPFIFQFKRW